MPVTYEISTTEIKPYTYKTPLTYVDDNGEINVKYSKQNPQHIKKLVLLNLVGRDSNGKIVSYEPIDYVNRFLLAHHLDDGKQESDQYSKGLVHFLSFLIKAQELWDGEYDPDIFDELTDLPRPTWDRFPFRKSQKITYQYREALKHSVIGDAEPSNKIAKTTATAYMNAVIKFYSFHIRHGHQFNNPPFEHEVITINYQASGHSMKAYLSKAVHTTDLRLRFGKSKRNAGGLLSTTRRDLKPLTNSEWKAIENILLTSKKILKTISGERRYSSISVEYCLFFLVARYTGLRKEEVSSLHKGQVTKPNLTKPMMRFGVGSDYGSLTKSAEGDNKSRQTIIPTQIMHLLFEYTRSDRYKKRLSKFKDLCAKKKEQGETAFFDAEDGVEANKDYVFISETGKPLFIKPSEPNARWNEIVNTVEHEAGIQIDGVIHNLRSTFAVSLFRVLLRATTPDIALAIVSECLGHGEEDVTLKYLKIAQQEPAGDEIYEDVLDFLGVFDELKSEDAIIPRGHEDDK